MLQVLEMLVKDGEGQEGFAVQLLSKIGQQLPEAQKEPWKLAEVVTRLVSVAENGPPKTSKAAVRCGLKGLKTWASIVQGSAIVSAVSRGA